MEEKMGKPKYLDPNEELGIQIGIASTDEEKKEIFRLRYRIYVEEMQRQPIMIDHANKLLFDEMDSWATLVYAKVGSELIGTMRANIGSVDEFPPELVRILLMDRFRSFCHENSLSVAFSSKLMVSKQYRHSTASHQLLAKGYEIYCNHHVQFNFGGCNFYLLRFYEQMGYRRLGKSFIDPGYGLLHPFILVVDDVDYLKTVRSPYYRIARKRVDLDRSSVNWFLKEFAGEEEIINSQLVSEGELWRLICDRLGTNPAEAIHAFKGVSDMDLRTFFYRCAVVVQCHAGDLITTRGLVSEELNILLSGNLMNNGEKILQGQHFGAVGIAEPSIQTAEIEAITSAEIIVVSRQYFRKFSVSHPVAARQILTNIGI